MPPKVKVTKEDIVSAAVKVVRECGEQALNARTLALILECSTQPIFSNFASMDELRMAVVHKADMLSWEYIKREVESGVYPPYKASGMAYIRFAKEERELFKLLYMRDRTNEKTPEADGFGEDMESMVQSNTGLSGDMARRFHLEMWAFVHGIAVMLATSFVDLDFDLASRMITDVYQGLRKQYGLE